jgi:hypothetical protein
VASLIQQRLALDRQFVGGRVQVGIGTFFVVFNAARAIFEEPSILLWLQVAIGVLLLVNGIRALRTARAAKTTFEAENGLDAGKQRRL